jgi:uncharacterized protein YgbK (DUF1537 family)
MGDVRILVIADDLSGAAEIAGIGLRHGLATRLVRGLPVAASPGLTVIDTDSRQLLPPAAAECVRRFVAGLATSQFDLIFKKTDSVLRGPIDAELDALMTAFSLPIVLLVGQNPSRGRTVILGQYLIDGVPLHKTDFARDPDHPAKTSDVVELVRHTSKRAIQFAAPTVDSLTTGITIGGAGDAQDIRHWARQIRAGILPAGGADFFRALLEHRGLTATQPLMAELPAGPALWICGSTSASARKLAARANGKGIAVCPMSDGHFNSCVADDGHHDDNLAEWAASVIAALRDRGRALVCIPQPSSKTPGGAGRLQEHLARLTKSVLAGTAVSRLMLEGGATAAAVCRAMAWDRLDVIGQLADGVVALRPAASGSPPSPLLLIKPGSYPWPEAVFA